MLFKTGRHNQISVFVISHGFYELPKDNIRENSCIIHHILQIIIQIYNIFITN